MREKLLITCANFRNGAAWKSSVAAVVGSIVFNVGSTANVTGSNPAGTATANKYENNHYYPILITDTNEVFLFASYN